MKRATYNNFNGTPNSVDYMIFGDDICVFSGIINTGTSTVNVAERVIDAINKIEQRPLIFYDLQTKKGYDYYSLGEYSFKKLIVTDNVVQAWDFAELPKDVLEAFKDHIGHNPRLKSF